MTETSILPGADATESGPLAPAPYDVDQAGDDSRRRRILILGAIVGVVVLAAAAFLLLHKGSNSDNSTFVPHPAGAAGTPAGSTTGAAATSGAAKGATSKDSKTAQGGKASKVTTLPKKAKTVNVGDPFKPLIEAPVDTSGSATSTTTVAASGSTSTTGTDSSSTGTDSTSTGTDQSSTSGPTPLWVQLMALKGGTATFRVGYAHHKFRRFIVHAPASTSHKATVFDKVFALVAIQSNVAQVQIGDDAPFELTTGVSHVV